MKASALSMMGRTPIVSSSMKDQNHGIDIHGFVHKTTSEAVVSASNAEETGDLCVDNADIEPDIETSRTEPIVYKRRSRRNKAVKDLVATESSFNDLTAADSETISCDTTLRGQTMDRTSKPSRKTNQMRKNAKRVSPFIETSEYTESGTGVSSHKRKVATKTLTETASCRQRKVTAENSLRADNSLSQNIEESKMGSQTVRELNTAFEEHNMDTVIEKVDPWLMLVHKKLQPEWSVYDPNTMRRPKLQGNSLKLISWNVNGLRALLKGKGTVPGSAIINLAEREDFDVLSLQETKLQEKDVLTIKEALPPVYDNCLWSCSTAKLGYSGTAVISRIKPLSVSYGLRIAKHDNEGRVITVEFDNFFLVTCYVPNSGQKLERLGYRTEDWDVALGEFLKDLEKKKPVVLTGDLNCAHQEIDIYNPDGNRKSAGFTDEERLSFEKNFLHNGFYDTFRKLHPNKVAYTYWGYRTAARPKNHGWRLDYFLASDALSDMVHDSFTLPDVEGSDHCPIGLTLKL